MRFKGFDIKIEEDNLVDETMKDEFRILRELKNIIRKHEKGTKEHSLLLKQIQGIKYSLKSKAFKVYKVMIKQKENFYFQSYIEYPTPEDIRDTLNVFLAKLRNKRRRNSDVKIVRKDILGCNYETIGGVFMKANAILNIQNSTDQMARIQTPKKPAKEFKSNYIGIELELFCKLDRPKLLQKFVDAKLAGYVYVKDDGSLRPENNYYPHEVTICCRQDDVQSVVPRIIKVLRSPECDAAVNNSCGMHVHIDIRNRDPYVTYERLVRGLPLLSRLVPKDRMGNRYCRMNEISNLSEYYRDGKVELGPIADREFRYQAINPMSAASHRTIEVRLHSGTVNSEKIINWVQICTSIADKDYTGQLTTPENFYHSIKEDHKLLEYMLKRSNLFDKGPIMDTRTDYAMDVASGF